MHFDDTMSETILREIESLKQILVANKPIESEKERGDLITKMKTVRNLADNSENESANIIKAGVDALEKAVEAFLNLEKNKPEEADTSEDIPENARPYQSIAFDKQKPPSIEEALKFFDQESKAITKMPFKPKAGEVILFKTTSAETLENWRAIGHRFNQGNGGRWVLGGLLKRKVANCVTPTSGHRGTNKFQRISWTHKDKPLTLVQFVGDDSVSVDFPHKNSKKDIPYIRTAPSVLRELEVSKEKPYRTYQQHVFNAPPDATSQNLLVPRNITQVRNCKQRFRKEKKGTDSLTNLIRISLEYEDVRFLMTAPDLVMVSITSEMLKQVREILKIDYNTARQKQCLGYDTQFNLGDYYVSWITIRDIRYKDKKSGKSPVLPAVQVVHERKLQLHHELAWSIITNLIPEISTRKFVATSDDEFTPLLEKFVGKGLVAKCEVHGARKIERWVSDHGGNKEEGKVLNFDFRLVLVAYNFNDILLRFTS